MASQNAVSIKSAGIVFHDGEGVFTGNNLQAATNTISSTDTNGNIILAPNGTGLVLIPNTLVLNDTTGESTITIGGTTLDSALMVHSEGSTDLAEVTFERHSDTAGFGAHIILARSRGTEGTETVVSSGDVLSQLVSVGHDGTDFEQAANIRVEVDGTPGAGDMPGRIVMLTSADGAAAPIEGLRLDNAQVLTLANALPVGSGGTGSTSYTAGSVIFSNGSILTEDNSNLFWDDTNNRLGIGTVTPLETLHVVGNMDLVHTASESDDHALEIECDAAGFGDVKAVDIFYTTGAMAATQDEEGILLNIDESASTGGIFNGYEVLTTAEGSAVINGYTTGVNVNVIVHESGTFGNATEILNKIADVTTDLASGGGGNISIFVANADTFTIGHTTTWDEFEIILGTGASGAGVKPIFAFSTGGAGFTTFTPADGTNGFRNTGAILWDSADLSGWATATSGRFEIKITRDRVTVNTTPIIDELQISSTTEFKWDKSGDVNVNSLALVSPLTVPNGGTGLQTITDGGVMIGSGVGAITPLGQATNGQLVIGSTSADPVLASLLSADATVVITAGAGSIDLSSPSGGLLSWVVETDATRALLVNQGVIGNRATAITMTLPTTAAVGSVIRIAGMGAGTWIIAQNASELIHFGTATTTTGVGGSLTSTEVNDAIEIVNIVADTEWLVLSSLGNITVT